MMDKQKLPTRTVEDYLKNVQPEMKSLFYDLRDRILKLNKVQEKNY
jgi:hypothetical protein